MKFGGQCLELAVDAVVRGVDVGVRVFDPDAPLLFYVHGEYGVRPGRLGVHLGGPGGSRQSPHAKVVQGVLGRGHETRFHTGQVDVAACVLVDPSTATGTAGLQQVFEVLVVELEKLGRDLEN